MRYNLSSATDRQFRAYSLPTGVSLDDMAERWDSLNFGAENPGESPKAMPFNRDYFRSAGRNIQQLRVLARAGKDETDKLALTMAGKRKVVWGEPGASEEEVNDSVSAIASPATEDPLAYLSLAPDDTLPAALPEDVTDQDVDISVLSPDISGPDQELDSLVSNETDGVTAILDEATEDIVSYANTNP